MGAVAIDIDKKARTIEEKYTLYEAKGIKKVIKEFYNIRERSLTKGDYDAVVLLSDLETAINVANLGPRQLDVVQYNKLGYKQQEIADIMGVDRKTVTATFNQAAKKIANVYKEWEYLDELLGGTENE